MFLWVITPKPGHLDDGPRIDLWTFDLYENYFLKAEMLIPPDLAMLLVSCGRDGTTLPLTSGLEDVASATTAWSSTPWKHKN